LSQGPDRHRMLFSLTTIDFPARSSPNSPPFSLLFFFWGENWKLERSVRREPKKTNPMGGCATKPKVSQDDPDGKPKAPQPEPEPEPEHQQPNNKDTLQTKVPQVEQGAAHKDHNNLNVNEIVDDDQANKPRSLSSLFKQVRSQIPQSQPFFNLFVLLFFEEMCF